MEAFTIFISFIIGLILGLISLYLFFKSNFISKEKQQLLQDELFKNQFELKNYELKLKDLNQQNLELQNKLNLISDEYEDLKNEFLKTTIEKDHLSNQNNEITKNNSALNLKIDSLTALKENDINTIAEIKAKNDALQQLLQTQKQEIVQLQEQSKVQFENLATKILEEKTEKFTTINSTNLKNTLEPFQEKINDLKNKVNEAYDKENKERFSLAEKVKELAELNVQISEDAKKLTRALKGESKTQGNWGEMILENILEKSGLVKGREYFLEYQLADDNNKALYSEFSGKKMRPDAVIKYPDERNVIIDSKVSLTSFIEMVDETDPEIYKILQNKHLTSVKNHINELSAKAYDDYGKSLDFVMMFIPSEPAYIAAMQADQNLWNYAYDKRILLLNPSNLITSLKLIADLWKREYQNKNTLEIAERGAKLYDKLVGFVENLDKVGKSIDNAQNQYRDAYKQLYTGKDNLISQAEKLKNLGVKNKKELSQNLIDDSQNI